ncbi:MAG: hypothetical protein QOF61_798 [Acidobacteriota bacterium]|jgi:hypothetical protein|nr:hypothetical protein [Acidobacteriota bacterium]
MERDAEVERVLLEIRERLRGADGAAAGDEESRQRAALARIEASLAVAARAWDRLPPIVSNRRGWRARLELWLKRRLRRVTNWFTWEQINFNAALRDALRATLAALAERDERQAELRERIDALDAELRELRQTRAEGERRRGATQARDAGTK